MPIWPWSHKNAHIQARIHARVHDAGLRTKVLGVSHAPANLVPAFGKQFERQLVGTGAGAIIPERT